MELDITGGKGFISLILTQWYDNTFLHSSLFCFTIKAKLSKRLTWSLEPESAVKCDDQYQTSNRLAYDRKVPKDYLKCPQNPLPPHHWDVHYINDFRSRFLRGGYRRPLSPSHQTTETKESYGSVDGLSGLWRPLSMRPFEIEDHHKDGPSKVNHLCYSIKLQEHHPVY